jgi:putative FmdB family regulatory protein
MPIYEFFCQDCNTIFSFLSRRINTESRPVCPRCGRGELPRLPSTFATIGKARESDGDDPLAGMDEGRMEKAMAELMREAGGINEEDPRQMAALMRRLSQKTGLALGDRMEEALSRLEAGEDPDAVEQEMGDLLEGEEPFSLEALKKKGRGPRPPARDETLYELE